MDTLLNVLPPAVGHVLADLDAAASLPRGTISLLLVLIGVLLPLLLLSKRAGPASLISSRRRDVVLLLGECKAGKTVMFHQLASGSLPTTVSSLAPSETTTTLFLDAGDASAPRVRLYDFPGHHRLARAPFRDLAPILPSLKCIVIVVDASDSRGAYLRDVAELMYDVLTHPPIADAAPSICVACNKQDVAGAAGVAAIQRRLEEELEKMKVSKVAVSATGDTSEKVLLGVPGQKFSFASDATNVSFVPCSAKTGQLQPVVDFIHGAQ